MIHPNQTIEVDAYNTAMVTCVAYGDPSPSISWNKGDTELTNDSHVSIYETAFTNNGVAFTLSILQLCGVNNTDAGQYSCVSENIFGNDTAAFLLTVNARGKCITFCVLM